jgi:hypothetical protein
LARKNRALEEAEKAIAGATNTGVDFASAKGPVEMEGTVGYRYVL